MIAYFSMEVGLNARIPTYSGGLGILAGDTLRSAADLGLPVVAVTMLPNNGFFEQIIGKDGRQLEFYKPFFPQINDDFVPLSERVKIKIAGEDVSIRAWRYDIKGLSGHIVPVYFLDTNGENGNRPWKLGPEWPSGVKRTFDDITSHLYESNPQYKIAQQMVLGFGGFEMLKGLGIDVSTYHMNEGHAAFLTLKLLQQYGYDADRVKAKCVFTTHTPIPAGHDVFSYEYIDQLIDEHDRKDLWRYAGQNEVNMTHLAMDLSRYINAVSPKHTKVSRAMFPNYAIDEIPNGVHHITWTAPEIQDVYDKYVPGWRRYPSKLSEFPETNQALSELVTAQNKIQTRLFNEVRYATKNVVNLEPDRLTLGFARRAAGYKRGDLIFKNIERLKRIGSNKLQIIMAGKAHPADQPGKDLIYRMNEGLSEISSEIKGAYLQGYDIELGKLMTSGSKVWLNNPQRPLEASGTSGMKAALNGRPSLSIVDGWWCEGLKEGITGWAIGNESDPNDDGKDAEALHDKLEYILNLRGPEFNRAVIGAIKHNGSYFNTYRMVMQYAKKAWLIDVPQIERSVQNLEGRIMAA